MKNCLLILMIMCCSVHIGRAQKIRFTDTSNKWSLLFCNSEGHTQGVGQHYSTDTIISGRSYHLLLSDNIGVLPTKFAIREDTALGRLHFRFLTSNSNDTFEHVLFDYGLKAGDTFKLDYAAYHFRHVVHSVDTVQLGLSSYRLWTMRPTIFSSGGLIVNEYYFVEGLGTTRGAIFSINPVSFEQGRQLRCFSNNGSRPKCTPSLPLPFANLVPAWPNMSLPTDSFDNDSSCIYKSKSVGVPSRVFEHAPVLYPNPGGIEIILKVPGNVNALSVLITDPTGRHVAAIKSFPARAIPIGQYLSTPGVYYYTLQDATTGQRYTGRFIFR